MRSKRGGSLFWRKGFQRALRAVGPLGPAGAACVNVTFRGRRESCGGAGGRGRNCASVRGGGAGTNSDAVVSCPSPYGDSVGRCVRAIPHPTSLARLPIWKFSPFRNGCSAAAPREGGETARNRRHGGAQTNKPKILTTVPRLRRGRAVKLPETIAMAAHCRDISADLRRIPK